VSATRIHIAIAVAALVWAVLLVSQGVGLRESYLQPYEIAAGVAVVALSGFDLWLWRFRPFRWFSRMPILRGTWKGVLQTTWKDPSTGRVPGPIEVYLSVNQTYSSISASLITNQSQSGTVACEVCQVWPGRHTLVGTYLNEPRQLLRNGSPIHHGTMLLNTAGKHPTRLEGAYWTDRSTTGELVFESFLSRILSDFATCSKAFTRAKKTHPRSQGN
jgi:hypothetical protein